MTRRRGVFGQLAALVVAASAATAGAGELACGEWRIDVAAPGAIARIERAGTALLDLGVAGEPTLVRIGGTPVTASWTRTAVPGGEAWTATFPAAATGLAADLGASRSWPERLECRDRLTLSERLVLSVPTAIDQPFDWREPFLRLPPVPTGASAWLPRKDGRAVELPLTGTSCAAYRIGGDLTEAGCIPLALPFVDLPLPDGQRIAIFTDLGWTTVFGLESDAGGTRVTLRFRQPAERVPFRRLEREVFVHAHGGAPWSGLDALFEHAARPGRPSWLDGVTLSYFDYLSDAGQGWFRDLDQLASALGPEERARTAVALHGWYDLIGQYAWDEASERFFPEWNAQAGRYGSSLRMSVAEVRRRLAHARDLGFRVLLYFADGTCIDSSLPRGQATSRELGINPWRGPEVVGELRIQNPADPSVRDWFRRYLVALVREFGDLIDGLVWDETFWVREGAVATSPEPAHADVAMMALVAELDAALGAAAPGLAFLASDALGLAGTNTPPYAAMAAGTWQDTECDPGSWSWGFFPNWRKPYWSVNWGARTRFEDMRSGVLRVGAPVALSNGWADDWGPAEMTDPMLDRGLELARELGRARRARERPLHLDEEPADWLARPLPGELVVDCWRVAGPWPNSGDTGLATAYPPELGQPVTWRPASATASGYVDLAAAIAPGDWQVGYAETVVEAPAETTVDLLVGSDDGVKVWLDGVAVLSNHVHRAHWPGADLVRAIRLQPGDNRLLVKVEQATASWGFSVRIQDPERGSLACRVPSAPPEARAPQRTGARRRAR